MNPYKQLASLIDMRMSSHASLATAGLSAELGTITANGLKLDSFKHAIGDYLVADWHVKMHMPAMELTGTVTGLLDGSGQAVHGQGKFTFAPVELEEVRLEFQGNLQSGDRVLAVPVNGGNEAVVLCKVVS